MTFNSGAFIQQLKAYSSVHLKDDTWSRWVEADGAASLNSTLSYYKRENGNDYDYRTWEPEPTVMNEEIGMLLSCKVDYERASGDDHIIILTGYALGANGPQIVFAKASVQFHGSSENNVSGSAIKFGGDRLAAAKGDFGQAIYDSLNAHIKDVDFGNVNDSTEGRKLIPDIARANVNAMLLSVH